MGFLDRWFPWFRPAPPPPDAVAPEAPPTPKPVTRAVQPRLQAPPKPKKQPKPPKPPKPPKERAAKAAAPKRPKGDSRAISPAPPAVEVLSVEEAERRYAALFSAEPAPPPTPPAPRAEPTVDPYDAPAPPPPTRAPERPATPRPPPRATSPAWFHGLLARADALLAVPEAELRHLAIGRRELALGWARTGQPPEEDAAELEAALAARLERFGARIGVFEAEHAATLAEHAVARRAIVAQAQALAEREDLRGAGPAMGELRAQLRACGPVDDVDHAAIQGEFASAERRLKERQEAVFAARDALREEQLARLDALVRAAEGLSASRDPETAASRVKQLQADWKAVKVPGPRPEVDARWTAFRAACDAVFTRRGEVRAEVARVAVERMQAVIAQAEALAEDGVDDVDEAIRKLMASWQKAGRAPWDAQDALWASLQAAFQRMRATPQWEQPADEAPAHRPFEELLRKKSRRGSAEAVFEASISGVEGGASGQEKSHRGSADAVIEASISGAEGGGSGPERSPQGSAEAGIEASISGAEGEGSAPERSHRGSAEAAFEASMCGPEGGATEASGPEK